MRSLAIGIALIFQGCTRDAPVSAPSPLPVDVPGSASTASASASVPPSAVASVEVVPEVPAKNLALHLVPLGDVDATTMSETAEALRTHAGVGGATVVVTVESAVPLPKSAQSSDKARYRADRLLDVLAALPLGDVTHAKVMGVTDVDIVAEKNGNPNWGILGLGAIDGRCSVISTYRMRRKFEKGGGASDAVVRERLWKISLHELGHTLGLQHCPTKGCIMEDGHGTVKTIDGETELCAPCATKFKDAVSAL